MLWSVQQYVNGDWIGVISFLTKKQALDLHRQYRRSFNRPFRVRRMS